jgi:hypothetical protein
MSVSPLENYYGIGTQALGQALPGLVNPYGSVGTNLTYVLGGALLQGLLGYQARQEANRQNLEIGRLSAQMTALPTATDRVNFLGGLDADSQVMDRLTKLQSALQGQETLSNAAIQQQIAQRKAIAPIELEIEQAKARGMTLEEYAAVKPQLEQVRKQRLAQALSGATTPQEINDAATELTAKDLIQRANAMRPTAEDALVLSPTELKQKQEQFAAMMTQGRSMLQLEKEGRVAEAQQKTADAQLKAIERKNIEEARANKPLVDTSKMVTQANKLRIEADKVMEAIAADPTNETAANQNIQKLITMANRIVEDNQTTLGELEKVESTQPLVDKIVNNFQFQFGKKAKYSDELVKSLYQYVVDGQQAIGELYKRQRDKTAETFGVPVERIDIADVYTPMSKANDEAALKAALIAKIRAKMAQMNTAR